MLAIVWETEHEYTRSHNILRKATRWDRGEPVVLLPPFSLISDFGKQNMSPAETFPKFPSVLRVIDRSDRNPPIAARQRDVEKVRRSHWWLQLVDFDPICQ